VSDQTDMIRRNGSFHGAMSPTATHRGECSGDGTNFSTVNRLQPTHNHPRVADRWLIFTRQKKSRSMPTFMQQDSDVTLNSNRLHAEGSQWSVRRAQCVYGPH
jgi:hypothetical protein